MQLTSGQHLALDDNCNNLPCSQTAIAVEPTGTAEGPEV